MGQLPPVVIRRQREGKTTFLGLNAWTEYRVGALSFPSEADARDWLRSIPDRMKEGAEIARVEHVPDERGQAPRLSEYDPYDGRH